MKRLFLILLFLIIPFFQPTLTFAQTPTTTTPLSENQTPVVAEESLWTKFWNWVTGIFIKTDYIIAQRPVDEINSDMTKYGTTSDNEKHSSSGTRLTDSSSQICYKGNVIRKVILDTNGYPDTNLAQICNSSNGCSVSFGSDSDCESVSIKDLARYFIQTNQKFYCDDKNKLIMTSSDVITAVNTFISDNNLSEIPQGNLTCYQDIYKDFYLVPKDTQDENEENSKKIVQTPISISDQDSNDDASDIKNKLNKNFIPVNQNWDGLSSLRPQSWGRGSSETVWGTSTEFNGGGTSTGTCKAIDSHCRGMSLYGAFGLSQSGKNYEEILKFYYGNITLKTINTSDTNILVKTSSNDDCSKYPTLNIETYLRGLGEMSDYWGNPNENGYESMKALVVAARTYAYIATQNFTQPICSNSNCQNFHCNVITTKPNLDKAIEETKGQIIVDSTNQTSFLTEYARSFCGPSKTVTFSNHTNPSVDGYTYEVKALDGKSPFCTN